MAGNKGAVAIRMEYAKTRLCFVTAHLAAGFANYEERNRDYRTITHESHGIRFQRNRSIEDHDVVIWLGDFNYRIGLSDDKTRRLIQVGDLDTLYQNDQVNGFGSTRLFSLLNEWRIAESSNDCWPSVPILFRSKNHLYAHVQIQQWD